MFLGEGLSAADARWIALNLIEAELRGVRSHGTGVRDDALAPSA